MHKYFYAIIQKNRKIFYHNPQCKGSDNIETTCPKGILFRITHIGLPIEGAWTTISC